MSGMRTVGADEMITEIMALYVYFMINFTPMQVKISYMEALELAKMIK